MGCLLALSDRTRGATLDQGRVSEQISLPFQSRRRNTHIHTQFWCLCDWNTLSHTREEMYSSSIFSLVKRIVQVLPARIVWKPVGLSRRDSVTKARWIRAAAFAPEPAPDKQSQHAAARAWEPKKHRAAFALPLPFVEILKEDGLKGCKNRLWSPWAAIYQPVVRTSLFPGGLFPPKQLWRIQ